MVEVQNFHPLKRPFLTKNGRWFFVTKEVGGFIEGFPKPESKLYSLQFTVCFWMYSEDKDNYGTPFSYATKSEDNEVLN